MSLLTTLSDFLDNIYTFPFVILPVLGGILSVFLFASLIFLIRKTEFIKMNWGDWAEAKRETPIPKGKLLSRWRDIQKQIQSHNEADWRVAIMGADSILDEMIKSIGYEGDTMGERLKNIKPYQFPNIDDAWRVHKIRNFLAHDPTYRLSRQVAEGTIEIYERIFKELGVI